jgi:hypothetical protein
MDRPSHLVQFSDEPDHLGPRVAQFLAAGLDAGGCALVAAKPLTLGAIRRELACRGQDLPALVAQERLLLLDGPALLARFMRRGSPDPDLFDTHVGMRVLAMARRSTGATLRIYGDMVDALADEREFHAALELEALWHGLAQSVPFHLLCGYSATNFTDPRTRAALEAVCAAHDDVSATPGDMLSEFLLRDIDAAGVAVSAAVASR